MEEVFQVPPVLSSGTFCLTIWVQLGSLLVKHLSQGIQLQLT